MINLLEENVGIDCYELVLVSGFLGLQSPSGRRKAGEMEFNRVPGWLSERSI